MACRMAEQPQQQKPGDGLEEEELELASKEEGNLEETSNASLYLCVYKPLTDEHHVQLWPLKQ